MASRVAKRRKAIKQRVLRAARGELGYVEGPNNDTKYGRWYGLNFQPWCGMAVSYVAAKARVTRIIPRFAYTPAGADWFKNHPHEDGSPGWGQRPRVGAIAFYDTAGLGRISHTGIVEKVLPGGAWYSLEGNTNVAGGREGKAYRRQRRTVVGNRGGFGYPDYTAQARREIGA